MKNKEDLQQLLIEAQNISADYNSLVHKVPSLLERLYAVNWISKDLMDEYHDAIRELDHINMKLNE